ncbi:MAG: 30S ribosomal protein S3 [Candidatus Cloacimonadota bacterium]|nr:MAG: 30S ribosomal protein S3 [Candidatus Cloacimonadota bacterium]
MGQKTNPIGFRIGVNKGWESVWFAPKGREYIETLHEDFKIRNYLNKRLIDAMISHINIDRKTDRINVAIHTARPGQVIGKKGKEINQIKEELLTLLNIRNEDYKQLSIDVQEIKNPEIDAVLVGKDIANQILNRFSYKRAMKRAIKNAMTHKECKGIKIKVGGRLNGADMARTETHQEGRTPLHTLRSDIDYALTEAYTKYGTIGIKVWIYKGEILK